MEEKHKREKEEVGKENKARKRRERWLAKSVGKLKYEYSKGKI